MKISNAELYINNTLFTRMYAESRKDLKQRFFPVYTQNKKYPLYLCKMRNLTKIDQYTTKKGCSIFVNFFFQRWGNLCLWYFPFYLRGRMLLSFQWYLKYQKSSPTTPIFHIISNLAWWHTSVTICTITQNKDK